MTGRSAWSCSRCHGWRSPTSRAGTGPARWPMPPKRWSWPAAPGNMAWPRCRWRNWRWWPRCAATRATTVCWPNWIGSPPGQPAGILGVLMQDTRRWAQGCHAALTGEPAAALHHFEQMTQPTLTRLAAYDRLDVAARTGHLDTAARWLTELEQFAEISRHTARPQGCRLRAGATCRTGGFAGGSRRILLAGPRNRARPGPALRTGPHPPRLRGVPAPVPPPGRRPGAVADRAANLPRPRRRPMGAAGRTGTPGLR